MMQSPADPTAVDRLLAAAGGRGPPPVHLWNPAHCGEIDIRILADGRWLHEGRPIGREALVRLFASVLRLDPDGYHLVTPAEKLRIQVEDAPFLAVALERADGALSLITNVGDQVPLDAEHPLVFLSKDGVEGVAPYVEVRRGLKARLTRPVFYQLAELAGADAAGRWGFTSAGDWIALEPGGAGNGA